jgi:NADH dehydrogenase FAD-containing subunit
MAPREHDHRGRGDRPLTTPTSDARLRRLVLIGAGRAHLHLLHAFSRRLVRGLEIVVVTTDRVQYDPAMASGILRGAYAEREARIDVHALAERAGARVVESRADELALSSHVVRAGAERIGFDLCSIDEIGPPLGNDLFGVAEHAIALRPAAKLLGARAAIEARLAGGSAPINCAVVGGGRTGVECAFMLQRLVRARPAGGIVTIIETSPHLLADMPSCRESAHRALEREGVCFALGARAVEVHEDGVLLASGGGLPSELVVWATGGAPPSLIAESGLPHDAQGRLLVDEGLRARSGAPVWAAGDCVADEDSTERDPRDDGERLERALRAFLKGRAGGLPRPRRRPICLIDTADGRAIVRWGPVAGRSRLAGWLKRRLDRRAVTRLTET